MKLQYTYQWLRICYCYLKKIFFNIYSIHKKERTISSTIINVEKSVNLWGQLKLLKIYYQQNCCISYKTYCIDLGTIRNEIYYLLPVLLYIKWPTMSNPKILTVLFLKMRTEVLGNFFSFLYQCERVRNKEQRNNLWLIFTQIFPKQTLLYYQDL